MSITTVQTAYISAHVKGFAVRHKADAEDHVTQEVKSAVEVHEFDTKNMSLGAMVMLMSGYVLSVV